MQFNIALSYGGRAEIVDAARRAIRAGIDPDALDEAHVRVVPLHGRPARSRSADSHERRDARQQLPAVADRLRGDLGHRRALAGLPRAASARSHRRLSEARSALRRASRLRRRGRCGRYGRSAGDRCPCVRVAQRRSSSIGALVGVTLWSAAAVGDGRAGRGRRRGAPASSWPGLASRATGARRAAARSSASRAAARRARVRVLDGARRAARRRRARRRAARPCSSRRRWSTLGVASAGARRRSRAPAIMVLAPLYVGLPLGAARLAPRDVRSGPARLAHRRDRRQRLGAVLRRPRVRPPEARAARQPGQDHRRRDRRPRRRRRRRRGAGRAGACRTSRRASRRSRRSIARRASASPAICSSRCSSAAPASRTARRSFPATAACSIASTAISSPRRSSTCS